MTVYDQSGCRHYSTPSLINTAVSRGSYYTPLIYTLPPIQKKLRNLYMTNSLANRKRFLFTFLLYCFYCQRMLQATIVKLPAST